MTPQVDPDGNVPLDVHPEVSNGNLDPNGIPSQVTTQLSAPSGRTVFIGRLIEHASNLSQNGVLYGIEETSRRLQLIHNCGGRNLASVFSTARCIAIRRGRPHMSAGLGSPLNCAHVDTKADASLCVPLIGKSESFGVLELIADGSDEGRQSLEDLRELVVTVAQRSAVTFAILKLSQYFREQSVRDPLTNLYNRRCMTETLSGSQA